MQLSYDSDTIQNADQYREALFQTPSGKYNK